MDEPDATQHVALKNPLDFSSQELAMQYNRNNIDNTGNNSNAGNNSNIKNNNNSRPLEV